MSKIMTRVLPLIVCSLLHAWAASLKREALLADAARLWRHGGAARAEERSRRSRREAVRHRVPSATKSGTPDHLLSIHVDPPFRATANADRMGGASSDTQRGHSLRRDHRRQRRLAPGRNRGGSQVKPITSGSSGDALARRKAVAGKIEASRRRAEVLGRLADMESTRKHRVRSFKDGADEIHLSRRKTSFQPRRYSRSDPSKATSTCDATALAPSRRCVDALQRRYEINSRPFKKNR